MTRKLCKVPGCDRPVKAWGDCTLHHRRMKAHGSYDEPSRARPAARTPTVVRFWRHVVEGENGCWNWTGSRQPLGYGSFRPHGESAQGAHRWCYRFLVGEIPDGLQLDHLCYNPSCVNPYHLDPVTPAVNTQRCRPRPSPTHCPQGHPYDEGNTARYGGGIRCKTCNRERVAAYLRKRREAA